ncbi:uncharacterized protein C4orf50 homolog [Suncus etruscus]|uniref:uncharacterized protein C4orf50 homolog n=1 Tax=Suncus etruscus TaxID=109475 RepID=UPI00210FA15C|nr:uncharacterized protein C4orf50 homolog [Suncus etruscus]
MEPQAEGPTQTFSYVVQAPGGDDTDVMNVKVKIDTRWVFRDADESDEEEAPGCAGREAAHPGLLSKPHDRSEQTLLALVDTSERSQSGLRSRIRELERSERRLMRELEQTRARAAQERSRFLLAQEQLDALRGALARQVREQERARRRQQRLRELVRAQDAVLGQQAVALERARRTHWHQLRLARGQERQLRAQVGRLQRDVRRLCRAASLLLAELDPQGPPRPPSSRAEPGQQEELDLPDFSRLGLRGPPRRPPSLLDEPGHCHPHQAAPQPPTTTTLGTPHTTGAWALGSCTKVPPTEEDFPGHTQARPPPLAPEDQALPVCRTVCCEGAPGPRASAGLPLGYPHSLHCVRAELLELPAYRQCLPAGDSSSFPVCLPSSIPPVDLAWTSQPGVPEVPAPEASLCFPLGELEELGTHLEPLLPYQEGLLEEHRSPQELDNGLPSAPGGVQGQASPLGCFPGQPSATWDLESRHAALPQRPKRGRQCQGDFCREGGVQRMGRRERERGSESLGCRQEAEDISGKLEPIPGSRAHLSLEKTLGGPKTQQHKAGVPRYPHTGPCPGPSQPLPRGGSFMSADGQVHRGRKGTRDTGGLITEDGETPAGTAESWAPECPLGGQCLEQEDPAHRNCKHDELSRMCFGNWLLVQGASAGRPEPHGEGASVALSREGGRAVPRNPDSEGPENRERCLRLPSWVSFPEPAATLQGAPCKAQDRLMPPMAELTEEMEAHFLQPTKHEGHEGHMHTVSTQMATESWILVPKWSSPQECAWLSRDLGEVCPGRKRAPEWSLGVRHKEREVLGTSHVILGKAPLGGFSELGLSQPSPPPASLERAGRWFCELVSAQKTEQSSFWQDNVQLQGAEEKSDPKVLALEDKRERVAAMTDQGPLVDALSSCKSDLAQALQAISDLEHCNQSNYRKISQLEEDKERLQRRLRRLHRAVWERAGSCRGAAKQVRLGNLELKALISELGMSFKELMQDFVLGIEGVIGAAQEENARLGRRIQGLEREAEAQKALGSPEFPQGRSETGLGLVDASERGAWAAGVHRPLMVDIGMDLTGVWPDSPSICSAEPAALASIRRCAQELSTLQSSTNGAGMDDAHLEAEEKKAPPHTADQEPALRSLNIGSWPWGSEADTPSTEQELKLCVRRLRLQLGTLRCQLRDQGAARDAALHLRDQLQGQLEELREKHHESCVSVAPLKAQLACAERKFQKQEALITQLLRERHPHVPTCPPLEDTALAQDNRAFLEPQLSQISPLLKDKEEEKEEEEEEEEKEEEEKEPFLKGETFSKGSWSWRGERGGLYPWMDCFFPAQWLLLGPQTHPDLQRPAGSPPTSEAKGFMEPDATQCTPKSESAAEWGTLPTAVLPTEGPWCPASLLQEKGDSVCPVTTPGAHSPPPPPELQSPARILAFHRELRLTLGRISWLHQSPLSADFSGSASPDPINI